jgi:hypothetical protein
MAINREIVGVNGVTLRSVIEFVQLHFSKIEAQKLLEDLKERLKERLLRASELPITSSNDDGAQSSLPSTSAPSIYAASSLASSDQVVAASSVPLSPGSPGNRFAIEGENAAVQHARLALMHFHALAHQPLTADEISSDRYRDPNAVAGVRRRKYWPPVGRVDNVHGDRNLFCNCVPVADWQ